jgi:hypothetical protein
MDDEATTNELRFDVMTKTKNDDERNSVLNDSCYDYR